jgi:hypothetical protein
VTVERAGTRLDVISAPEYRGGWAIVLTTVLCGVCGLIIAIFGRPRLGTRGPVLAMPCFGIGTAGAPNGSDADLALLSIVVYSIASGATAPLSINWLQRTVGPVHPARLALPWLLSVQGIVVFSYWFGAPVPAPFASGLFLAMFVAALVTSVIVIARRYRTLEQLQRRQVFWLITSSALLVGYLATLYLVAAALGDDAVVFGLIGYSNLIVPLGLTIAILAADFGRIDRAVSVSVTYALLVVCLGLAVEFVVEPLAAGLATRFGMPESAGTTVLIVVIALGAPPLKSWLEPRMPRLLAVEPS